MDVETFRSDLRQLVAACEAIDRDAELVEEDTEFIKNGGEIVVAVDFSEIFSLLLPSNESVFALFPDDTLEDALFLQRDALTRIFWSTTSRPLLLPPYVIEFQSFLVRMRSGLLADVMDKVAAAAEQWRGALQDAEVAALLNEAASIARLTPEQIERAIAAIERHAPAIRWLLDGGYLQPLRTADKLLRARRFVDLSALVPTNVVMAESVRSDWYDSLTRLRGADKAGASFIDAAAMALIKATNEAISSRNKKLLFVTRSTQMHEVFDDYVRRNLWTAAAGGYIVRHPRSFSSMFRTSSGEVQRPLARNGAVRTSLKLLITSAHMYLSEGPPAVPGTTDAALSVRDQVGALRAEWRRLCALSSSLRTDVIVPTADDLETGYDEQRLLLTRLLASGNFVDLVNKRLAELFDGIDKQQEFLGWIIHSGLPTGSDNVLSAVWLSIAASQTAMTTTRLAIPCTLYFHATELREWARSLSNNSEVAWQDVVAFLRDGFKNGDEYEWLLAMAFLLGALGKWPLAEKYCDRSLEEGRRRPSPPTHEAYLFGALCRRMHSESPSRYAEALKMLATGMAMCRAGGDSLTADPRFLREYAQQVLMWNRDRRNAGDPIWNSVSPPQIEIAITHLESALRLADGAGDLLVTSQILNSLCYYFADDQDDAKRAAEYRDRLVGTLRELYGESRSAWPPSMIDTVAWANFKEAADRRDTVSMRHARDLVAYALTRSTLDERNRGVLLEHLKRIRAQLMSLAPT